MNIFKTSPAKEMVSGVLHLWGIRPVFIHQDCPNLSAKIQGRETGGSPVDPDHEKSNPHLPEIILTTCANYSYRCSAY